IFEFGNKRSEAVEAGDNNKIFENYLKSYGESHDCTKKIEKYWGGSDKFWFNNDNLRKLLIDIMYNGTWSEFKNSEANLPDGLKKMQLYVQPYFTKSGGKSIAYACEASDESIGGRWAAKLIFNPEDGHWYNVTGKKPTDNYGMTQFSQASLKEEIDFYDKFAKEYFIPDNIVQ
ncbi:MAG: hypothetical protein RSA93_03675, partial [Longicatena sp.]